MGNDKMDPRNVRTVISEPLPLQQAPTVSLFEDDEPPLPEPTMQAPRTLSSDSLPTATVAAPPARGLSRPLLGFIVGVVASSIGLWLVWG